MVATPNSNFKTYMNEYFGWLDINTWTSGQRSLEITVKPAQMWTPAPRPTPFSCTACTADINKDKSVDIADFSILSSCYMKSTAGNCINADINKDGLINSGDYACLSSQYRKQCK